MNGQLLRQLEDMGLSEKEARVYVANLILGPATVQQIANQADIKRVTAYVILESLANLGLISQTSQGKKTYFTAEDPTSLRRLLDKKEREVQDQKKAFDSFLPDLESLKNISVETPTVKYYDTLEGMRSVIGTFMINAAANGAEYIYGLSDIDKVEKFFPEIAKHKGNPERIKAGKHSRFIYTSTRGAIYQSTDKEANRESRYVPIDKYPISGDLTIAGDYMLFLSLDTDRPFGVTIKSAPLATALRSLYELAWISAEQYQE